MKRKSISLLLVASGLLLLSSCNIEQSSDSVKVNNNFILNTTEANITSLKDIEFSNSIMFAINNGAAGFGTIYDCMDATIKVYYDRHVEVIMPLDPNSTESGIIAEIELSQEDFEKLKKIAKPETIYQLDVKDGEGSDGSSNYIWLYDKENEVVIAKGGYMAEGEEYSSLYRNIKEILAPYNINETVAAHRKALEEQAKEQ